MAQLFYGGQNSNDWSEWTTEDTTGTLRFQLASGSALGGSAFGVSFDSNGGLTHESVTYNVGSTSGDDHRIALRIKDTGIAMSGNGTHVILRLTTDGATETVVFQISLYNNSAVSTEVRARASARDDGGTFQHVTDTTDLPTSQDVTIEARLKLATGISDNNGELELFVNGTSVASRSDIDIFVNSPDASGTRIILFADGGMSGGSTYDTDEFYYRNDTTQIFGGANAFRFLGFSADAENMYIAGLKDGTLKLYDYDLATLTENGTASFGSGTDAEIDAQTRGIFPVARPSTDEVLYLYGRDGNNVQVQYNDRNGTLGWTDIGPGTATWGTGKMATGLFPSPTRPNDVIVVFRDNDVYRTILGTTSWVKQGDMTEEIVTARRHPTKGGEILYGGTAAGTAYYSHNYGVSDSDAGGTAMGTINAFFFRDVTQSMTEADMAQYQGAGSSTVGGTGGTIYEVTKLDDDGSAGTFRHAVEQSGARIVNIKVDGYIDLTSRLNIDNPNLTINGDQSGGKGVCLRNNRVVIRTNEIIIRHMRFRVGDNLSDSPTQTQIDAMDCLSITNNGTDTVGSIILDHCTFSWGIDENVEIWNSDTGWVENITVQWCIFADPLRNSLHTEQGRAKNILNGPNGKTRNISFHHNLFVSAKDRNPQVVGDTGYDVDSNVLFNIYGSGKIGVGDNSNSGNAISANVQKNVEIDGPDQNASGLILVRLENKCAAEETDLQHQIYENGNVDKDSDTGWANVTCCDAGAGNIPAHTRFQVGAAFTQPGEAITIENTGDLVDILVNGTGYSHAGVGACPGGTSGRDGRDAAILAELVVARDSGAGAVDTSVIKPVDTPSDVGGYPSLT